MSVLVPTLRQLFDATELVQACKGQNKDPNASNGERAIMKILGVKRSLDTYRWDLLYLVSQLSGDDRSAVVMLAGPVQAALDGLSQRRTTAEQVQADAVMAGALVAKRDETRDRLILRLGGVARATWRDIYERLFPKLNPSQTIKLGVDAQSLEMARILGEIKALDVEHPLRKEYELPLTAAQGALEQAKEQAEQANLALVLQRSLVHQCKIELDKLRLETHGKLVALLANRQRADGFFRPSTSTSEEVGVN